MPQLAPATHAGLTTVGDQRALPVNPADAAPLLAAGGVQNAITINMSIDLGDGTVLRGTGQANLQAGNSIAHLRMAGSSLVRTRSGG